MTRDTAPRPPESPSISNLSTLIYNAILTMPSRHLRLSGHLPISTSRTFFKRAFHASSRSQTSAPFSSRLLKGKKVLITGASRGIGASIASRFAAEGARCILVGRNEFSLSQVRDNLSVFNETEGHEIHVGDVGSEEFWHSMGKEEKRIEVLVNAAGITHYSPFFVSNVEALEGVVRTNLLGTLLGCRFVGKRMMGRGGELFLREFELERMSCLLG